MRTYRYGSLTASAYVMGSEARPSFMASLISCSSLARATGYLLK